MAYRGYKLNHDSSHHKLYRNLIHRGEHERCQLHVMLQFLEEGPVDM